MEIDKSHLDYRLAEFIHLSRMGEGFDPARYKVDAALLAAIPEIRARITAERPGVEVGLTEEEAYSVYRAFDQSYIHHRGTVDEARAASGRAGVARFLELRTLPPKPERGGAGLSEAELQGIRDEAHKIASNNKKDVIGLSQLKGMMFLLQKLQEHCTAPAPAVPRVEAAKLDDAAREQIADDADAVFCKHVVNVREIADYVIGQTLLRVLDAAPAVQVFKTVERKPTEADGHYILAWSLVGKWWERCQTINYINHEGFPHWMPMPPAPESDLSAAEKAFKTAYDLRFADKSNPPTGTEIGSFNAGWDAAINFSQEAKASV